MGSKRIDVRWVTHAELSAAHAAYVVATGAPCIDPKTEQLLIQPVTEINNRLLSSSIDVGGFWQHYLTQLLCDDEINRACAIALMRSGCSEMQLEQTGKAIGGRLGDARAAFMKRFPKLEQQLQLRAGPLRDKWDTFGSGLLRDVGRQVWDDSPPDDWWPDRVTASVIQPMRGGDGGFAVDSDRIWFEAVLTDNDPSVPEVLRVAWLITRMAIENYIREKSFTLALAQPWSLVSVPLVLRAAANLELIRGDDLPIQRAMQLWHFGDPEVAAKLTAWWQQYTQSPAPLPAALRVLDEALEGPSAPETTD